MSPRTSTSKNVRIYIDGLPLVRSNPHVFSLTLVSSSNPKTAMLSKTQAWSTLFWSSASSSVISNPLHLRRRKRISTVMNEKSRYMLGNSCTDCCILRDENDRDGFFFVFESVGVSAPGLFCLEAHLYSLEASFLSPSQPLRPLATLYTNVFEVFSASRFRGMGGLFINPRINTHHGGVQAARQNGVPSQPPGRQRCLAKELLIPEAFSQIQPV
ncbi:hypothetical protein EDD86DRAFT_120278 [Gorgonomyces haynaldii]|nr:hypothetical protein EDD86DRAFT_120278 [Gorgonomyces haynaldii]